MGSTFTISVPAQHGPPCLRNRRAPAGPVLAGAASQWGGGLTTTPRRSLPGRHPGWLATTFPPVDDAVDRGEVFRLDDVERSEFNATWPAKLYAGGWICATWPAEYGGKGLSTLHGVVLAEEFARARAPMRADFFGDTLVGPTLLQWGTEEQKATFLPQILRGEIRWCQGFSEPNSGSDLASLATPAVLDGDEWVINGQKVWTTGPPCRLLFLLTRTDPAPHTGISYLLVPMRQDGVEARITQPDGTAEFCEVFFTNARCPAANVVGGVNNGWKVANSTLAFERGCRPPPGIAASRRSTARCSGGAPTSDRAGRRPPAVDVTGRRSRSSGSTACARCRTRSPGAPADLAALGATYKMFWSEMHRARWSWRSTSSVPRRC